jgi:hypothetical protein
MLFRYSPVPKLPLLPHESFIRKGDIEEYTVASSEVLCDENDLRLQPSTPTHMATNYSTHVYLSGRCSHYRPRWRM